MKRNHRGPQRGADRYNAKLTDADVPLILALRAERERLLAQARELTDAKIAEKFDVHPNVVWKIGNGAAWIHVATRSDRHRLEELSA